VEPPFVEGTVHLDVFVGEPTGSKRVAKAGTGIWIGIARSEMGKEAAPCGLPQWS
jgi:hypothetical protein